MGFRKKKNIIILTLCVVISFILYQLYFFLTISSEIGDSKILSIVDHAEINKIVDLRSESDKYINDNGVIRGVFYHHVKRYRPTSKNEYKCLNSEQYIPFDLVNDDYCDCEDGTDEPSTNACVNGTFYCDSQYLAKPISVQQIPSSKVNDGICDCCDGSDEWLHGNKKVLSQSSSKYYRYYVTKCPNNCK